MSSKQTKSGKPITTSVPSFAIRFHTSGEELEELYPSEEEEKSEKSEKSTDEKPASENPTTGEANKHESSPMRDYLNKFGKRSSSIDTGINESTTLNQQTSDPWRIFSEFKGKLTKTVEEKLSEIKSKSNDSDSSPKHTKLDKKSSNKDNISDSEEQSVSECSIPKSNLSSTAEDLEMSSDDENSFAESDKTPTETKEFSPEKPKRHVFKHKIKTKQYVKFTPSKDDTECQVKISTSSTVVEKKVTVEDEVESGIEAYEDFSSPVDQTDVNVVTEVLVAPTGFVDLRARNQCISNSIFRFRSFWPFLFAFISICFILPLPTFVLGFLVGIIVATTICVVYYYLKLTTIEDTSNLKSQYLNNSQTQSTPEMPIFEIQAAKEYQPVTKFEGWINEFPEHYDPTTYHIARTQSVFLKLEGSILRISHTRSKIPKRAMWNEQKHKVVFSHHRIYNLQGSQVTLLPNGLIHKRLWSKKYPICIILNKEKMCLNLNQNKKNKDEDTDIDEEKKVNNENSKDNDIFADPMGDVVDEIVDQVMTDDDKDIFSESFSDAAFLEEDRDEVSINAEEWDTLTLDDASIETKIYLFGRTCRDKEDWHRRLVAAAHDDSQESEDQTEESQTTETETNSPTPDLTEHPQTSEIQLNKTQAEIEFEYLRYMAKFNQVKTHPKTPSPNPRRRHFFRKKKDSQQSEDEDKDSDTETPVPHLWVNSLIARMLYDVYNHEAIIIKIQDLFQRKLSTIKLPYFIEDIVISDLSLGKSSPIIHRISSPSMDERGLWIDMDLTYEGLIRMALVTKLNLMKLKEQAGKVDEPVLGNSALESDSRSPMFHSDVEDSAESSSDEENTWLMASSDTQDSPAAKGNTGGRKFLRMVDKIAASKYFQHATDNKYIKRAMDHVSKTEFKLNVEIQFLEGTLTLNMPPPPSDRIWLGFRDNPKLQLSAHPTFGDRSLNFNHVTRWIEKKLSLEFQKFLVLPNMEDFVLPVMNPVLPS